MTIAFAERYFGAMNIPDDVRELAQKGLKIQAVKRLRQATNLDLTQAKEVVDRLAQEQRYSLSDEPIGTSKGWRVRSETRYGNIAFAGFVIGGLLTIFSLYQISMAARTYDWARAEGLVLRSSAYRASGGGVTPFVLYEYEVAGARYEGKRVAYGKVYTERSARRVAGKYSKGRKVTVYYDPDRPSVSVLERGGSLGIGVFLALGVGGVFMGFWARRKRLEKEGSEEKEKGHILNIK